MTITSSTSAPLIVVVGSTGTQGGSVVKALAASTKSYRVRAITRDTSKPAAQALVALDSEVVAADTTVPEDLAKAFEGADLAFLFTTSEYTVLNAAETVRTLVKVQLLLTNLLTAVRPQEYNKGKLQVDAAKAAGISTILLSSEPNLAKLSGGKFQSELYVLLILKLLPPLSPFTDLRPLPSPLSFQGKADVATYARETLGLKVYETFAPSYATNLLGMSPPRKQEDGSFKLVLPYDTERLLPISDIAEDFGKVRKTLWSASTR